MAFPEVSLKRRRRRASEISVASSLPSVPYSFSSFMAEQSCRILREYNLAFFRMSSSNSRSVTPCAADPFQMPTKPWGTWGLILCGLVLDLIETFSFFVPALSDLESELSRSSAEVSRLLTVKEDLERARVSLELRSVELEEQRDRAVAEGEEATRRAQEVERKVKVDIYIVELIL